jgi:HlyD family secretion protein
LQVYLDQSRIDSAEAQFREAKSKESVISKVISKSDWDKSIASFEVAKPEESLYFSVKVLLLQ